MEDVILEDEVTKLVFKKWFWGWGGWGLIEVLHLIVLVITYF